MILQDQLLSVEIKFDETSYSDIPDARTNFDFNSDEHSAGIRFFLPQNPPPAGPTLFRSWQIIKSVSFPISTPVQPGKNYPYLHIQFTDPNMPEYKDGIVKVGYEKKHSGLHFYDVPEKKLYLIPWRHIAGITEVYP